MWYNEDGFKTFSRAMNFTAVYKKHKNWYLGWVEEIPGVNTQGKTLKETKENLKEALGLILEANKSHTRQILPKTRVIREPIGFAIR